MVRDEASGRDEAERQIGHVGIVGIHGPEATAVLQALLERGATLTAWSRRIDHPWAERLARRGVSMRALSTSSHPAELPASSTVLDWLLIFPGSRLAKGLSHPELLPESLWPSRPDRIVRLLPAGLAMRQAPEPSSRHVVDLSTTLVLERWLNVPMRRAIGRGRLPFPRHPRNALPLISTQRIAQVILALCEAKLSLPEASVHLAGEWIPLPELLNLCRRQVGRPVRSLNRRSLLMGLRMGQELALMARWAQQNHLHQAQEWQSDNTELVPVLDGMRRLPW